MRPIRCIATALFGAAFLGGCSTPTNQTTDPLALKATAWEHYAAGDYQSAEHTFRSVLNSLENDGEAFTGQGWSLLYMRNLESAVRALARVSTSDSTWYVDARAGIAIAYDARGEFSSALSAVRVALTLDSAWVFLQDPHTTDTSTDWRDLEYLRAKCNLMLGAQNDPALKNALAALARIDGGAPLDAADPASWTTDGVQYGTLAEALLKRLESIAR